MQNEHGLAPVNAGHEKSIRARFLGWKKFLVRAHTFSLLRILIDYDVRTLSVCAQK
jgi:hypothetical protein